MSSQSAKLKGILNGKRILIVVTGASRGIGRELAVHLAKRISAESSSVFILLARTKEALEELKKCILNDKPTANVELLVADLAKQPFLTDDIDAKIRGFEERDAFDVCLIFHNAGSVGEVAKRSSELNDEAQWHEYLQTNLVSSIVLNNKIYSALKKEEGARLYIINITSLLSVKAYPSFTQYSVGKAAREAYFRAFATEHSHCRVLNYAPGPVDTDMHVEVREKSYDASVREVFATKRHDSNLHRKLLSPEATVKKLIQVLEDDKFENGARVDYFDK